MELVDEILETQLLAAWEDDRIRTSVGAIRSGENDPTYFQYFEQLAKFLIDRRTRRKMTTIGGLGERNRRGGGRKTLKRGGTRK
jgi:hypothetical protein